MKKLIAISTIAFTLVQGAYAQGTLIFANSSGTRITADATSAPILGVAPGANIPLNSTLQAAGVPLVVGLYYSPSQAGTYNLLAQTPFSDTFTGRFSGGTIEVPGVAGGSSAFFQIRVWESTYGANYEAAAAAAPANGRFSILGQGTPASLQLASAGQPPAVLSTVLTPFTVAVAPVPEPSTIALGLLGLVGLFVLRRRQ
jgi:hypothetical protein